MENSKNLVNITVNGEKRTVIKGTKISEIIALDMLCGGHGKCGKCKVKAKGALSALTDSEILHLSQSEISDNVRLACFTEVLGECSIESVFKPQSENKILTEGVIADFALKPAFSKYGIAIDIGTTTLAAKLYNTKGETLAESSILNPQSIFGADVVSRIESALKGESQKIAEVIINGLDKLVNSLSEKSDIAVSQIDGAVITGNTVMLHLLTNTSTEPLSHAPFKAERLFGETLTAAQLKFTSLKGDTQIYLPACISAFVGADTVCALTATEICNTNSTKLLADIGTNGEIALWHNNVLTVCSTAAGPAFEGVGITMGMRGETGAIDRVTLDNGKLTTHVIGNTAPRGICGSGIIDAVSCLLETEDIDETGFMEEDSVIISSPVIVTAKDIRAVQLAKSAICAGINTVMKEFNISTEEITELFIAGGFGSYLNLESAGKIGLIPQSLVKKVTVTGNSALSGAAMMLLNSDFKAQSVELSKKAVVLELSSNPTFTNEYMEQMMF